VPIISGFADDPGTKVIINILEGARDGRAYRDALAYATAKKPVVVLKLGRTDAGRAAAQAHTGSLAGSEAAYDAAIRDSGAAAVTTIDEMIETTSLFSKAPIPKGDKVFIFSVSGGASVLAGDLARTAGLNLVPIPKATARAFGKILGVTRSFANPMDVVGAPRLVKGDNLTRCLRVALRESRFDAIGFVLVVQRETSASHHGLHEQFRAIAPKAKKPVVMISEMAWQPAELPTPGGPALAGTLDVGLAALRHLVDYGAYRRAAQTKPPTRPRRRDLGLNGSGPLTEPESNEILDAAGIPLARWRFADSAAGAARAASQIGSPVAVKAVVRGLAHKTEAGAVRLDVSGSAAVRHACTAIAASLRRHNRRARIEGFLVQEMVPAGVEMILGGRLDPQFGPIVLIGAGGTLAELAEDVAVGVAPLSRRDATRMVASLKAARLLQGFRGAPKADRRALIDLMVRFSRFLAATEGQIAEIDLNPVKVLAGNNGVRVVDSLIVPQSGVDRLE
jgi:acetyltransferase